MDFTLFGWRDGVLLVAVGTGVYVAFMLLRLLRLGRRKGDSADFPGHAQTIFGSVDSAVPAEYELPFQFPPPLSPSLVAPAEGDLAAASAAVPPAPTFAESLEANLLEQEVRQLRAEVAALREELLDVRASHRVSPQYADAMALARRGFDARGIADHCGIALGEAELVKALARGADDLQAENDYVGIESGSRRATG